MFQNNWKRMPFQKGQSGNPGGRPKIAAEFKDRARSFMDERGFAILTGMLDNGIPESEDRRYAMTKLIEYAYGKPQQHVNLESNGPLIKAYIGVDTERV